MSKDFQLEVGDIQDIIVGHWTDPAFRARLKANPTKALLEWGIEIPEGIEIRINEDVGGIRHITIPTPPNPGEINLKTLSVRANSSTASACRPCASYKARGV